MLKQRLKKVVVWCIILSLVISGSYDKEAKAEEKLASIDLHNFITDIQWSHNGTDISEDVLCQFSHGDVTRAVYDYTIPAGKVAAGTEITMPISELFHGRLISGKSDKVEVSIQNQQIVLKLKGNTVSNSIGSVSGTAVSTSGAATDLLLGEVKGKIEVEYSLTSQLRSNSGVEMKPSEINSVGIQFLTDVELAKEGKDPVQFPEASVGTTPMDKEGAVYLFYYFGGSNNTSLDGSDLEGKEIAITLPKEILLDNGSLEVTTSGSGGTKIADAEINGKILTFKFSRDLSFLTNIKGFVGIPAKFDKSKIGKDDSLAISFDLGTIKKDVQVHFKQTKEPPVIGNKTASTATIDGKNGLKWTIKVSPKTIVKTKAIITESWENQTYKDGSLTVKVTKGTGEEPAITIPVLNENGTKGMSFEITNFGTYTEDCELTITYNTIIDPLVYQKDQATKLSNKTDLTGPEIITSISKSASITITPKWISKVGIADLPAKKVNWEITINESLLSMYGANFKVDFLGEYLTLDEGEGVKWNINGLYEAIIVTDTVTNTDGNITGFGYGIGAPNNPLTKTVTFKFATTIADEYFQTNHNNGEYFDINASLTWNNNSNGNGTGTNFNKPAKWEDEGQKPLGGNTVVTKKSTGYDQKTGEISWEIEVLPLSAGGDAYEEKQGVKVTDTLIGNHTFVGDSLTINGTSEHFESIDTSGKMAIINLGTINDKTTINFKSKIADANIYKNVSNDRSYKNSLVLTATSGFNDTKIDNVDPKDVNSKFLRKESVYSKANHTITWTIYINESGLPLNNAVIYDALPEGITCVPDTFSLVEGSTAGTPGSFPAGILDGADTTDGANGSIIYDFSKNYIGDNVLPSGLPNGEINKSYVMQYKTQITDLSIFDQNGNNQIVNKVWLRGKSMLDTPAVDINYLVEKQQPIDVNVVTKSSIYKSGSSLVSWVITVNQDEMLLKNAVIEDDLSSLPGNMVLEDSEMILIKGNRVGENMQFNSSNAIEIKSSDYTYDPDTKKFSFYLPEEKAAYQLTFMTKIMDTSIKNFKVENIATYKNTTGTTGNETEKTETAKGSATVALPISGGSGNDSGPVTVINRDRSILLEGAEFQLISNKGSVVGEGSTDNEGKIIFGDLLFNTNYQIKQIKPAPGYKLDTVIRTVSITDVKGKTEVFEAEKYKTEFSFKKVSEKGEALAGASFNLYETGNTFKNAVATVDSDANGFVFFKDIPYGQYTIAEVVPPRGYELSTEEITVNMSQGLVDDSFKPIISVSKEEFVNYETPGNITITLTDKDTKLPLKGGVFEIHKEGVLEPFSTGTTDEGGEIELTGLEIKDYTIKQTKAPEKYGVDTKEEVVKLIPTENDRTVAYENAIITSVIKINVSSSTRPGRNILGAKFEIYKKGDDVAAAPAAISDKDGNVYFYNMPYGNYVVKQVAAIEGYLGIDKQPDVQPINISITDDTPQEFTVTNIEITGTVTVTIKDKVADVEYTLYDEEGNVLAVSKTDKDGILIFENVVYGSHKMKQTKVPSGYEKSDMDYDISIKDENDKEDIIIETVPKIPVTEGGGSNSSGSSSGAFPPVPEEEKTENIPDEKEQEQTDENEADEKPNKTPAKTKDKKTKDNKNKEKNSGKKETRKITTGNNDVNYDEDVNSVEKINTNNASRGNATTNSNKSSNKNNIVHNNNAKGAQGIDETLPQAGSFLDFKLLVVFGAVLLILGLVLELKKKKVK